ncbi:MAG: hypothetical protein ABI780_01070 [Ardenticatenales bacterium]
MVTIALAAAVLTALGYTVLAERSTYASVRRRQLDAWAAIVALFCILFLASGGHDVRRAYERRLALAQPEPTAVIAISRRSPVVLRTPSPRTNARPNGDVALYVAAPPAPEHTSQDLPAAMPESATRGRDRTSRSRVDAFEPSGAPLDDVVAAGLNLSAEGTGIPAQATASLAEPTEDPHVIVGNPPPLEMPTVRTTFPLPTPPPPAASETPTATSTPQCGNPDDIELALSIREAHADRSDGELVIRYRIEVGNGATFPVTLANLNITALNSSGGSETYGHATRPDMSVGAGGTVTLEGGLRLDRSPGPFGRTELCISLAADSCGRRSRYEAFRRCSTVNGF